MSKIRGFIENHDRITLLYIVIAFLAGMILGLLISPVKNGVAFCSNNGSYNDFTNSNNVEGKRKKAKKSKKGKKSSCPGCNK